MRLRLGFLPLTDCAPLAVAAEKGFFAAEDLDVALSREASWANIRDKVAVGMLDGAHMLAPLPLAMTLGVGSEPVAMAAPMTLCLNGVAFTIAARHAAAMRRLDPDGMAVRPRTAGPLKRLIEARRAVGKEPLTLAVVYPYSMHNYALRDWLAAAGIDPDADVRITVAPPPRMPERLAAGDIDGFCAGAPWSALAVAAGTGEVAMEAADHRPRGPDKVLGVTAVFAREHADAQAALVRALEAAAAWADAPANHAELATLLAAPAYVGVDATLIQRGLAALTFHRGGASRPNPAHALWLLAQMRRWGQIGPGVDAEAMAATVFGGIRA